MSSPTNRIKKRKFRGCLLGSLCGNCLAEVFHNQSLSITDKEYLQIYFDRLKNFDFLDLKVKFNCFQYSSDILLMKSVVKFLVDKPVFDYKFLARLFLKQYQQNRSRVYFSQNLVNIFEQLQNSGLESIFRIADSQYNNSGSSGNGGAARIAPVALYFNEDLDLMINVVIKVTKTTHSNILAVYGAFLQCFAIQLAFKHSLSQSPINPIQFCNQLKDKMGMILHLDGIQSGLYIEKLNIVKHLLRRPLNTENRDVSILLGTSSAAIESVPTAIFCFLKAIKNDIPTVVSNDLFRRTIQFAISLGGDTVSIAGMAGAIAGAYLGQDMIKEEFMKLCQHHEDILQMADNIFALCK